ncbi:MAG: efflux RND transporter periplasmic adaptor subunit [Giesbergeria sp.]
MAAIATLCVLAAAGALLVSTSSRAAGDAKEGEASKPRPALAVTTIQPTRSAIRLRLPANGNVAAWQEASIGADSNGLRLTEVRVNVGDQVSAGQVLAVFAADTVQAEVAQARASLLEAKANAAEAAANADRAQTLTASGALSQQQIQQYATASQTAQARVAAAQAMLNAQQLRLQYAKVLAPDSGVISARSATVGAVLGAGTELFRMVRKGRLEWRAEVSATDLPRIHPGDKVNVTSAAGTQVAGTVRMLAPTVDPKTRNALIYVDLPKHADLRAGMFAQGEFLLGEREALSVPQSALVLRDGFQHVFEVDADNHVVLRRVQIGQRVGERVEIVSGLKADTRIVARGGAFLNDGDLVHITEDSKQKQAPALIAPAQAASK